MLDQVFREGLIKDKRHELGLKNSWDLEEEHRERHLNYENKQNTYWVRWHGMARCIPKLGQSSESPGKFEKYRFISAKLKVPQVFLMISQVWVATVKNMFNTCSLL